MPEPTVPDPQTPDARAGISGIRVLTPTSEEWPNSLDELGPAEPVSELHVQGRPLPNPLKSIAIVGTRRPTVTGLELAREMAAAVAEAGFAVVSGLALGIDAAAHRGALEAGGHTVAVLGCGLDVRYLERNMSLRRQIAARGTLVSEYPQGTPARAEHFPARNRIIVGLSDAVIVVEGGFRSGALITARIGNEAGRKIFAIPGSPRNAVAIGPNELIRSGATLVTDVQQVFDDLAPGLTWDRPYRSGDRRVLTDIELRVLHSLDAVPVTAGRIGAATDMAPGEVALTLSKLELRGLARRTRTGQYEITKSGLEVSLDTA